MFSKFELEMSDSTAAGLVEWTSCEVIYLSGRVSQINRTRKKTGKRHEISNSFLFDMHVDIVMHKKLHTCAHQCYLIIFCSI